MKAKMLSHILTVIVMFFTFHSSTDAQTTLEESNYINKGLKIQLESGLDMKNGYKIEYASENSVVKSTPWNEKVYNSPYYLQQLIRLKDNSIAAYIYVYNGNYLCIPHPASNSEVTEIFKNKVIEWRKHDDCIYLQELTLQLWNAVKWDASATTR